MRHCSFDVQSPGSQPRAGAGCFSPGNAGQSGEGYTCHSGRKAGCGLPGSQASREGAVTRETGPHPERPARFRRPCAPLEQSHALAWTDCPQACLHTGFIPASERVPAGAGWGRGEAGPGDREPASAVSTTVRGRETRPDPRSRTGQPSTASRDSSVQFSSVPQPCPTLCGPTDRSTPGLPVQHQLTSLLKTHVH